MSVRRYLGLLVAVGLPLLVIVLLRAAMGALFSVADLLMAGLFVMLVLVLTGASLPYRVDGVHWRWSWRGLGILAIGAAVWLAYLVSGATWLAWFALAGLYALILDLDRVVAPSQRLPFRWGATLSLALLAGAVPVLVVQLSSSFADEEFFAAVQVLALSALGLVLLVCSRRFWGDTAASHARGLDFNPAWLRLVLVGLFLIGAYIAVWGYQHSFYPSQAPAFAAASESAPFVCGNVKADGQTYDGARVFERILARVQANPHKAAPEYGMLAVGTKDQAWAQLFRQALLDESGQQLFTGPANSIKSVQFDAALRAYYYAKVRAAFPGLFGSEEVTVLRQWFAAINRRALTVEWVDWLYALAFAQVQEGPYANQENGAGLLAVLELNGLQDPALDSTNKSYLERNPGGWSLRFRNTDDAIVYQPEWITNAFFQSLYTGQLPRHNADLSFEWLLLQALPDGATMGYNHPETVSLAPTAYLAARLLGDGRYIWLAGRALDSIETRGEYLSAQPGIEEPVDLPGHSPAQGSCLLYAGSGLPNQKGPLAPDKIVFRSGWSDDSSYLLLNLRFTGWHRYKATNSLTLFYKGAPVASELLEGEPFAWLPEGRSLFRDKRVPRENLNGLMVEREGLDSVLYQLTGMGGPWAQDPPFYARVDRFETGADLDTSTTVIPTWHGWEHRRSVYFEHDGPVVIADDAVGPSGERAELMWHVTGKAQAGRIRLGAPGSPVEMVLLPVDPREGAVQMTSSALVDSGLDVTFASSSGVVRTATVFLAGEWLGAKTELIPENGHMTLVITAGSRRLALPLFADGSSR